jgi:hypothetical protein
MKKKDKMKIERFILRSLPIYLEKKIKPFIDKEKHKQFLDNCRKKRGKIIKQTARPFCRSISSVLSLVLNKYGYNSSVHFVKFIIGNKEAQFIFKQYGIKGLGEIISNNLSPNAYTIGCGFTDNPNDFHCITKVGQEVIDMTANQMKRISKGIDINNFWMPFSEISKVDEILIYLISKRINPQGFIFTHPHLFKILNSISLKIGDLLERKRKLFSKKEIKHLKEDKKKYIVSK